MPEKKYKIERVGEPYSNTEIQEYLKHGSIPLKFCYLGKGANSWDKLRGIGGQEHNIEFGLGKRENQGLINVISKAPLPKNPINVIHVGVGNGIELPAIVSLFDFQEHSYFGLDISYEMIQNAILHQKKILVKMKNASFIISDVEKRENLQKICNLAKSRCNHTNYLLFSGEGTLLSNLDVFSFIADALENEDIVIISLEGDDKSKREEMLSTYNLAVSRNLYKNGLDRAGITEGFFLPAQFNEDLHRVEVLFETSDNRKILCLTSYKPPSKKQFAETLASHCLQTLVLEYFSENRMYGAVCKKGEHSFQAFK